MTLSSSWRDNTRPLFVGGWYASTTNNCSPAWHCAHHLLCAAEFAQTVRLCWYMAGELPRHAVHVSLLNRVTVVADPESDSRPHSAQEYLSAFIRAQIKQTHAEVTREPSSFASGGSDFYRADYKWADNGTTVYSSMVCIKRKNYWLSWNFVTPSQRDLDDAVNTVQHISFDSPSPHQQ